MNVLFLCSYLSGYLFKSIEYLSTDNNITVEIIHWGKEEVAPYKFESKNTLLLKSEIADLTAHCMRCNPQICYVAGWIDKDYLTIARKLKRNGTKVIGAVDNPWNGSLKQQALALAGRFYFRSVFDYVWVAGKKQYYFVRKLDFPADRVLKGLYVADIELFSKQKRTVWNKEILYAGRLEEIKGVSLLYQVFSGLNENERNGWTLRIVGNGKLKDQIQPTSSISVMDFIQQDELAKLSCEVGAFVLPSTYEHWGVVVQEFASASLPMVVSSEVNAREEFVIHNYNGYVFQSLNAASLKSALVRIFNLDEESLCIMGNRSRQLAFRWTHEYWKATLLSVLE
ncbi:MAG TPA: glycosyltransferase [Saprospiraceae bacterium]|nr:glycosyltransferase [Saprospiraceae bacterium]